MQIYILKFPNGALKGTFLTYDEAKIESTKIDLSYVETSELDGLTNADIFCGGQNFINLHCSIDIDDSEQLKIEDGNGRFICYVDIDKGIERPDEYSDNSFYYVSDLTINKKNISRLCLSDDLIREIEHQADSIIETLNEKLEKC